MPAALTDVDRLLRNAARVEVARLEEQRAPVEPLRVAERVVYAHNHLTGARARRADLISLIADYIRELRASGGGDE